MSNNVATEKTRLRRIIRDAKKNLKDLSKEDKVLAEIKKWEERYNLKQDLEKLCKDKGTTLKNVMAEKDYYIYAQPKGSRKAIDNNVDWVKAAIQRGTTEAQMLERANKLKRKYVLSKMTKRKKKKSSVNASVKPAVRTMG